MILVLAAAPVWAVVTIQNTTVTIKGVDSLGNPSDANSGTATGKLYKDVPTGILYEAVSGIVTNHSKVKKTSFVNLGVAIADPAAGTSVTATNDLEVIHRAKTNTGKALAGRVAVFVP